VPSTLKRACIAALIVIGLGAAVLAVVISTRAGSASAAVPRDPTPPPTVTGTLVTRPSGTLPSGTLVGPSHLGQRIFANGLRGFALASVGQADYGAITTNGGKTWRIAGAALHLHAAQAPLVVTDVGAANGHTFYAYGGGQVVDATRDSGRHWYRALLGDVVMAVVSEPNGRLVAFAQVAASNGTTALNWVYVSTDGGHHWHYNTTVGTF
jgi:hypothetical protein